MVFAWWSFQDWLGLENEIQVWKKTWRVDGMQAGTEVLRKGLQRKLKRSPCHPESRLSGFGHLQVGLEEKKQFSIMLLFSYFVFDLLLR